MKLNLGKLLVLVIFAIFVLPVVTEASPNQVSVRLASFGNKTEFAVTIKGQYFLEGNRNYLVTEGYNYVVKLVNGQLVLYKNGTEIGKFNNTFTLQPVKYDTSNYITVNSKRYLGTMKFERTNNNFISPINTLPLEDYLKGVVPHEMPSSWHLEALKAQALAARTYAYARINSIMVDTTANQVYDGYNWYSSPTRAVNETKGQIVEYNNKLISAVYSSSNGGRMLSVTNAWGSSLTTYPYLTMADDPYTKTTSDHMGWTFSINKKQIDITTLDVTNPATWDIWWNSSAETDMVIMNAIKAKIQATGSQYKIIEVSVLDFDTAPYTATQVLRGSFTVKYVEKNSTGYIKNADGSLKIQEKTVSNRIDNLRSYFGNQGRYQNLRSPNVESVNFDGTKFTVKGNGFGHGIGMSQYGAQIMANNHGKKYRDILSFYYRGTQIDNYYASLVYNLEGIDRFETSAAVADQGWVTSDVVVLGRGDNPVDALTGSVLAKKYNAPLLLTNSTSLPKSVNEQISDLRPKKIYLLGGPKAISTTVENSLKAKGYTVTRLYGAERYDTAIRVANEVNSFGTIILTTDSSSSPDALSVAPYAGVKQIPVLYTNPKQLTSQVSNLIKQKGVKKVIIIGGTSAVSTNVESTVKSLVGTANVQRIQGIDRYETSINIVKTFDLDSRKLFFARGEVFIDSLAGSAFAAKLNAPIILVNKDRLSNSVFDYINENINYLPEVYFLGGTDAISTNTRNAIKTQMLN